MMEVGRNAPSWGVETPAKHQALFGGLIDPYAFAVGEPVTYVQAPKAKGHRNRALPVFELPDHGL